LKRTTLVIVAVVWLALGVIATVANNAGHNAAEGAAGVEHGTEDVNEGH